MDDRLVLKTTLKAWGQADKLAGSIEALYLQLRDLKSDGYCHEMSVSDVNKFDALLYDSARLTHEARDAATLLSAQLEALQPVSAEPKKTYRCDEPDHYCPFDADSSGQACYHNCGLGADE